MKIEDESIDALIELAKTMLSGLYPYRSHRNDCVTLQRLIEAQIQNTIYFKNALKEFHIWDTP